MIVFSEYSSTLFRDQRIDTLTTTVNGVEYGQAVDSQKGAAKDMAAKEALQKLNQSV